MRKMAIAFLVLGLGGCAMFEDWVSVDDDGAQAIARSGAEAQSLMELSITTGRFGVMLGQAREILRLSEPQSPIADDTASSMQSAAQEKSRLAALQVHLANELMADTAQACRRRKLAKGVKILACDQQKKMPIEFRVPVEPDLPTLETRSDRVGAMVMEWWEAVCATAPRPKNGEPSACSIE